MRSIRKYAAACVRVAATFPQKDGFLNEVERFSSSNFASTGQFGYDTAVETLS
jgi:hypothetical protein